MIENTAAPSKFAATINDCVASQAQKYVYGTNDTQLRFVANRLAEKFRSPLDQQVVRNFLQGVNMLDFAHLETARP
jgi:hypothetical protein